MIRVLVEHHHADLYESLGMLFEDRFGWELYRLYGMEFWDEKVWNYERHMPHGEAVARQYLQPMSTDRDMGDHWERDDDVHPGRVHKMVTLEQVRSQRFDIVIATLTENEQGLHDLARSIGAKFGLQLGNEGTVNRYDLMDFALFSTGREFLPLDRPFVTYHQEFNVTDQFYFQYPPVENDVAATWVQCLPSGEEDWERFKTLAGMTPELRWFHHGHCNQDSGYWRSNVKTTAEVAKQMRAARIGIHFKRWSDGYGHVLHNLCATGKPLIATSTYYKGKLGEALLIDGQTSFDVQVRSNHEVVEIIRRLAFDDEYHEQISRNMAARFKEVVNFDDEAEQLKTMLDGVLSDRTVAV